VALVDRDGAATEKAASGPRAPTKSAYGPGGWPQSVGAILIQNVFRGYDLQVEDLIVKDGEARIFEVVLSITSSVGDGDIDVDFSTNDFQVTSPFLSIRITS